MPKVTYTAAKGLVQEAGSGVSFESTPYTTVKTQNTSSGSVVLPGVYTVSGGYGVNAGNSPIETIMPLASVVPGGVFTFRATSADAHYLTGSAESAGTKVFSSVFSSNNSGQGSKVALSAATGASVTVMSDGKNFLVLGGSGSLTFSGT